MGRLPVEASPTTRILRLEFFFTVARAGAVDSRYFFSRSYSTASFPPITSLRSDVGVEATAPVTCGVDDVRAGAVCLEEEPSATDRAGVVVRAGVAWKNQPLQVARC